VHPFFPWLHPAAWIAWIIYWRIAGLNAKPTERRDDAHRWLYQLPVIAGFCCFILPVRRLALRAPLFSDHPLCWEIGTVLLAAGMAISIWARVELGRNWSNVITVKVGHELIQSGPYRWVRHPIYTGILLAVIGSALAQDLRTGVAAVALVFLGFWIKLRREEAWMRGQFGAQYEAYAARTPRLLPFLL
jgi:protein-S-isoprenylcysteine O-methyltransferase Ste14